MYPVRCPKCSAARTRTPDGPAPTCAACGLVFAKWIEAESGRGSAGGDTDTASEVSPAWREGWLGTLLSPWAEPPPPMSHGSRIAHGLLLAVLFLVSWRFILGDVRTGEAWNHFLHGVNLVFHEAGHVFLIPFGRFMHVLGGTLGQLAMPLIVAGSFIYGRRDPVGAAVGLWWFGQSLTDCAPYIADARKLELPLLGGGTGAERDGHDWQYLLGATGLSNYDTALATLVQVTGSAVMLGAIAWGGRALWCAEEKR